MTYMKYNDAALYHSKAKAQRDMITVETTLLHETDRAYFVDTGEVKANGQPIGVWVPKSVTKFEEPDLLHLPEWLAVDKRLI